MRKKDIFRRRTIFSANLRGWDSKVKLTGEKISFHAHLLRMVEVEGLAICHVEARLSGPWFVSDRLLLVSGEPRLFCVVPALWFQVTDEQGSE